MASTEERVTAVEFDLKQFRTETVKAYTDMAYEMTIVKGLGEDSIKRLAALRTEVSEIKATQQEHTALLHQILAILDERK